MSDEAIYHNAATSNRSKENGHSLTSAHARVRRTITASSIAQLLQSRTRTRTTRTLGPRTAPYHFKNPRTPATQHRTTVRAKLFHSQYEYTSHDRFKNKSNRNNNHVLGNSDTQGVQASAHSQYTRASARLTSKLRRQRQKRRGQKDHHSAIAPAESFPVRVLE